jgi:hypothetical protein
MRINFHCISHVWDYNASAMLICFREEDMCRSLSLEGRPLDRESQSIGVKRQCTCTVQCIEELHEGRHVKAGECRDVHISTYESCYCEV